MDIGQLIAFEERNAAKQKDVRLTLFIQSKIVAIRACILEMVEWRKKAIEAEKRLEILNEMYLSECRQNEMLSQIIQQQLIKLNNGRDNE